MKFPAAFFGTLVDVLHTSTCWILGYFYSVGISLILKCESICSNNISYLEIACIEIKVIVIILAIFFMYNKYISYAYTQVLFSLKHTHTPVICPKCFHLQTKLHIPE